MGFNLGASNNTGKLNMNDFLGDETTVQNDEKEIPINLLVPWENQPFKIALGRPVQSSMAVLGEMSISGTLIRVDELANTLQVCLDSGAKKILMPAISMSDFASVPDDLSTAFDIILYKNAEEAVIKALSVG